MGSGGQHMLGAVTGSYDILGGVSVNDVGGDQRFDLFQAG